MTDRDLLFHLQATVGRLGTLTERLGIEFLSASPERAPSGEAGGTVATRVASPGVRASSERAAAQGTAMLIDSGRSATRGAFTGAVPVVGLGQVIVAVCSVTGRNGKTTASTVASSPSPAAARTHGRSVRRGVAARSGRSAATACSEVSTEGR